MRMLHNYNVIVYPANRYVTLGCDDVYFNANFDIMLKIISNHYWDEENIGTDKICSLIRDKINREWHLNGFKKSVQKKRISTNQIKAIRRSFQRVCNRTHFIRIPFHSVPIIFFILNMLNNIPVDELSMEEREFLNAMNNDTSTVGVFLFEFHTALFDKNYRNIVYNLHDFELIDLYNTLHANLHNPTSVMNCSYSQVNWEELEQYVIT